METRGLMSGQYVVGMDVEDWEAVVGPWGKLRKRPCVSPLCLSFFDFGIHVAGCVVLGLVLMLDSFDFGFG